MILYPPLIEGTLPPFIIDNTLSNNKIKLTIPYQLSRGGYIPDNGYFKAVIKTIPLDNQVIALDYNNAIIELDQTNKIVTFNFDSNSLFSGEYYKIQIAICQRGTPDITGYFSTPSIIKFTNKPVLEDMKINGKNVVATFSSLDPTEYLYSSKFIIYDFLDNKIEESEEIIYDSYNNQNNQKSLQNYEIKSILLPGYEYKILWKIKTNNGLQQEKIQSLFSQEILEPDYNLVPYVKLNYDNSLIDIGIKNYNKQGQQENIDGSYILGDYQLFKSSSLDNFKTWNLMTEFTNLTTNHLSVGENLNILVRDYNIQHGERYIYKLSQINRNKLNGTNNEYLYLNSIGFNSQIITVDFEDMFLCDEDKQLRIAFNPKISTFKNVIMESKLDTIGGKYPYFFRNEDILYKEFNLSGLISYLEDPDNLFNFTYYNNYNLTDLSSVNIYKERIFKEEVLNWLNNGQTKLLKTPTEGNYFIRLMNVSLSPNDTLGRMLHTFTATGYEVDNNLNLLFKNYYKEYTENNLRVYTETNPVGEIDVSNQNIRKMIFSNIPGESITIEITGYYTNNPNLSITQTYIIGQMGYYYTTPTNFIITKIFIDLDTLTGLQLDIYEEIPITLGPNQDFKKFNNSININFADNSLMGTINSSELSQNNKIYNKFQFYKLAQFIQTQYTQEVLASSPNNQVQLIDSSGQLKTYEVFDQLLLEDCYLNIQNLGNNLRLEYCIAKYNN